MGIPRVFVAKDLPDEMMGEIDPRCRIIKKFLIETSVKTCAGWNRSSRFGAKKENAVKKQEEWMIRQQEQYRRKYR